MTCCERGELSAGRGSLRALATRGGTFSRRNDGICSGMPVAAGAARGALGGGETGRAVGAIWAVGTALSCALADACVSTRGDATSTEPGADRAVGAGGAL